MQLCFLGTASGLPEQDRFGQTVVVSIDDNEGRLHHYILDAGDGASSIFARNGFDHREISAIMISHMHGDHHGGFLQLVKTCMHYDRTEELVIIAPQEGIPVLRMYLEASYLYEPFLGFPINWISMKDVVGQPITLPGGVQFESFPNSHLDSARQRFARLDGFEHDRTFESYSMSLVDGETRLVYSGNLKGPAGADELATFIEPCDVFVCELAHVNPLELGRFLVGKEIGLTAIAHFHPRWGGKSDDDIVQLVIEGAGGQGDLGTIMSMRDGQCLTTTHDAEFIRTRQLAPHTFK